MKLSTFISGLVLAFSIFCASDVFAGEKIAVVADEWCPYNCVAVSEKPGFMVEIAKSVFAKHGIEVEYIVMPWSRAVELTRQGQYDAIIGSTKGDAPDFIFPKMPQAQSTVVFLTNQDSNWVYKDINSLENVVVGVIDDYSYSTDFDEYVRKNKNDRNRIQVIGGEKALELNIKKLMAGRIDTFPEDINVVNERFSSMGEKMPFRIAGEVTSPEAVDKELFMAFSPKDPKSKQYAKMLSDGTRDLQDLGELKKILDKYGVKNWLDK